jgi:hypothetical protein
MGMPWKSKDSTHSKVKSAAYLVYSEWEPQHSVPRDRRLAQEFAEISPDLLAAWREEFDQIDQEIWKIAEQG